MQGNRAYIFIFQDEKTEQFMDQYYAIEKQLKDHNLDVIKKGIDIHNYTEVIQSISIIIKNERERNSDTKIFVNLSVGTKITAIAAMDACRFWDCTPYYVMGEHYIPEKAVSKQTMALSYGKMEIFIPPVFKLIKPEPQLIEALKIIAEKKSGIYKKEFRKKLLAKNLLQIQKKYELPSDPKKLSAEYMAMNQQYIYPLKDTWNYIQISDAKRNQKISLTELGEETIQIFKNLS